MSRKPIGDPRELLWTPEFEVRTTDVTGQAWPLVWVEKFETNGRGERRYIETRTYGPIEDGKPGRWEWKATAAG